MMERTAHIFAVSRYPEYLPLPPVEALCQDKWEIGGKIAAEQVGGLTGICIFTLVC